MTADEAAKIVAGPDAIDLGGVARILGDSNLLYDEERKLASAVLTLVEEGRKAGAFDRAATHASSQVHGGPNVYCAEGWAQDEYILRALAGADDE